MRRRSRARRRPWRRTRGSRGRSTERRRDRIGFRDCVRSIYGVPRKRYSPYLANEQEENVAGRIEEEASWKCMIARRRGSLWLGRRGQRRCRYAERSERSPDRRRGREKGERGFRMNVTPMNEIIAQEPRVLLYLISLYKTAQYCGRKIKTTRFRKKKRK